MEVKFYKHQLDATDATAVAEVLSTPFLTSATRGGEVERQISEFFSIPHCKLTNSCTNGGVATLLALGIGPGDEVVVPAMTFIATANMVELVGATPVFVDVCPTTLLMDLGEVKKVITEKTKAIIPVHLYGQLLDVKALRELVGDEVFIVEDCAHSFEGKYQGHRPGAFSDAALFSFYATKNLTCGEGGAVITRSLQLYERLCQTVLHGMSAGAAERFKKGHYRHWDMVRLGVKANLPDLLAVLLPPQIVKVEANRERRERLARAYESSFQNTPLRLQTISEGAVTARHLFPIHVEAERRDEVIATLNRHQIGVTVNYRALHCMTFYREKYGFSPGDFPVAFEWGEGTLSLPLYPTLPRVEQDTVIDVVLNKILRILE